MIEFRAIASSSAGCAYHVTSGEHPGLLIDAGISFRDIQQALNFRVSDLAGCLISHGHGDHSKAVPNLLKAGVNCYASPDTWNALQIGSHRAHDVGEHEVRQVGPWLVTPFKAVHDESGTLGFVVDAPGGGRLVYLTDSAYAIPRFEGVTVYAVEANHSAELLKENALRGRIDMGRAKRTLSTHMSIERLLQMFEANDMTAVEEIHLLHLSDANSSEEDFRRQVERATGKPVYIAAKRAVPA